MQKNCLRRKMTALMLATALLLTGCSGFDKLQTQRPAGGEGADEFTSLGLSPEFDYEVPESLPSILVDQVGYACGSNKLAMVNGEQPPGTFTIVDAKTGREVYTGKIEQKSYDETLGAYISHADFTDFNTLRRYYIQASSIGQSYEFEIAEEPFAALFQKVFKQYYCNRCGLTLSAELAGMRRIMPVIPERPR